MLFISFLSVWVRMSWNLENNRNLFVQPKSKMGPYHVVVKTPKNSPERLTLTVVEMQKNRHWNHWFKRKNILLTETNYNAGRKVCVNFNFDSDKMNIAVYRYRNNWYRKGWDVDLKVTKRDTLGILSVFIELLWRLCQAAKRTG